ncbi:MAG: cupin domain-containing protein [Chloroflexi bacterium]|nr:MAG: cupin domain-containing protein [Chloroflexota bacterium]
MATTNGPSPVATSPTENLEALGAAIRRLRQERRLSLRHLSGLSGLSIGFLSLVERGRSSPALTSLHAIAKALGTDVPSFFTKQDPAPESAPQPHVARAGDDDKLAIASSNRAYRLLSERAPALVLEPMLVTIQPGGSMEEPYSHDGEEFAYVLSGSLRYVVDATEYRLDPGDSIHFQSTVPHGIQNDGDEPVTAVWVVTPRLF